MRVRESVTVAIASDVIADVMVFCFANDVVISQIVEDPSFQATLEHINECLTDAFDEVLFYDTVRCIIHTIVLRLFV